MIRALVNHRKSSWERIVWFFLSWVLPATILLVIALKLFKDPAKIQMLQTVEVVHWAGLASCFLLLPLNVGLEAWKWKIILKSIEKKSMAKSFKTILAGKSLNVISPFGIGDGFARYFGLLDHNKAQVFAGLAIDRVSQMIPTLVFGGIAVYGLLQHGMEIPLKSLMTVIGLFSLLGLIGFIIIRTASARIEKYIRLFRFFKWKRVWQVFALSFGRYAVFMLQFYLVFWALGNQLSILTTVMGIAWIFLIKTTIPDMSVLGDLVKRELSATLFFSFFVPDLSVVLIATFFVWVINIVLPALLGLLFVSDLKRSF